MDPDETIGYYIKETRKYSPGIYSLYEKYKKDTKVDYEKLKIDLSLYINDKTDIQIFSIAIYSLLKNIHNFDHEIIRTMRREERIDIEQSIKKNNSISQLIRNDTQSYNTYENAKWIIIEFIKLNKINSKDPICELLDIGSFYRFS
jgi:hypothetical protein